MKLKTKLILAAALAVMLSILSVGSLAYFTAETEAHNTISSGKIDIALNEWNNTEKTIPFPTAGVSGIVPGESVVKIVEVKNNNGASAWVRVKAEVSVLAADGVTALSADPVSLNYNTTAWTQGANGIWYYNTALAANSSTVPLFTQVTFAPSMGNAYQNCVVSVNIVAQAVQSANNGTNVQSAQGWPSF